MEFKAFFVLLLFLCLTAFPVHAAEINPSVESQPLFCRYSITKWTPLCVVGTGGAGSTTINADNTTNYYNTTFNESYTFANTTSFFNLSIGNNLTTISNFTYFTLVNVTYSEMNQTPGPQGPQGIQGIPGPEGPMNQTFNLTANMTMNMTANMTPNMTAGPKGDKGDKGDTGLTGATGPAGADGAANMTAGPQGLQGIQGIQGIEGPMNMTPNMTANMTMNMTMNQTVLDISWNTSYQTIANQSAYDIAMNTSMKDYVDYGHIPVVFVATNGTVAQGSLTAGTKLKYTTSVYDTGSYYNASNSSFNPKIAGYYYIHAQVQLTGASSTTHNSLLIYKNGASQKQWGINAPGALSYPYIDVSGIVYLNGSSDIVDIYFSTSDTARTTNNVPTTSYFEGYKL